MKDITKDKARRDINNARRRFHRQYNNTIAQMIDLPGGIPKEIQDWLDGYEARRLSEFAEAMEALKDE
jgi:hypothetical protein